MSNDSLRSEDIETIHKYSDMVYKMAYSMVKNKYDAEDIHQEVFEKYLRCTPRFESDEHKKAWLLRVTINRCKNLWKSAWKQKIKVSLDEVFDEGEEDRHDEIIDIIKQLPSGYRVVIHLFYYEELSVGEIAEILQMKESSVRTRLTRARKLLKKMMEE